MFQIIIKLLCITLMLVGVILIFDARIIVKRFFSFGDQNDGVSGLKILGIVIFIIGAFILRFFIFLENKNLEIY